MTILQRGYWHDQDCTEPRPERPAGDGDLCRLKGDAERREAFEFACFKRSSSQFLSGENVLPLALPGRGRGDIPEEKRGF